VGDGETTHCKMFDEAGVGFEGGRKMLDL
jgi:hypothetical protein